MSQTPLQLHASAESIASYAWTGHAEILCLMQLHSQKAALGVNVMRWLAGNKPGAADVSKDAEEEGWAFLSGIAGKLHLFLFLDSVHHLPGFDTPNTRQTLCIGSCRISSMLHTASL